MINLPQSKISEIITKHPYFIVSLCRGDLQHNVYMQEESKREAPNFVLQWVLHAIF